MRSAMEVARQRALEAPTLDLNAKCIKCGGGALPKYHRPMVQYGVTVPEHMIMTCGCGYSWTMKPLHEGEPSDAKDFNQWIGAASR